MVDLIPIVRYLRQRPSQSLQLWQLEQLFNLDLHVFRQLFWVTTGRLLFLLLLIPAMRPIKETSIVLRHKSPWWIDLQSALRSPSICIFAYIAPNLSIMLKLLVPIINGANGWLCFQYFRCNSFIILLNIFIWSFLLDCKMTFSESTRVVSRVSMFFDLVLGPSHDVSYTINKTLILSLHIISFEVWYFLIIFRIGERRGLSSSPDHRLHSFQISIMPSLILKVQELLCFLDVH